MDQILAELAGGLPDGWVLDETYGLDFSLVCPHGHTVEADGRCPSGCVSPLRAMGLI